MKTLILVPFSFPHKLPYTWIPLSTSQHFVTFYSVALFLAQRTKQPKLDSFQPLATKMKVNTGVVQADLQRHAQVSDKRIISLKSLI